MRPGPRPSAMGGSSAETRTFNFRHASTGLNTYPFTTPTAAPREALNRSSSEGLPGLNVRDSRDRGLLIPGSKSGIPPERASAASDRGQRAHLSPAGISF